MESDLTSFADIHNHLVPDVDDGARSVEDTIEAVQRMTGSGIRKIVTTPHLDGSLTRDAAALDERLCEVSSAFDEAARAVALDFPEVDFRRGHEVMLDVPDVDFSDPRLRLAGTRFVLVEWPRLQLPPGTTKVLRRVSEQGYRVLVAHPERYIGMDVELAGRWKEAGALLQVNHGSLEGRYGGEALSLAMSLLRRGWVEYLATDFHARPDHKLYMDEARARLNELGAGEAFVMMSLTNPARVMRDEPPIPVPALPAERGLWARMRGFLRPESV